MYPRVVGPLTSGVAAGADGEATANATSDNAIRGRINAVRVQYLDTPPQETTIVTIATSGTDSGLPGSVTILTLTNANTDGWFYPRHQVHGSDGAGLAYADEGEPVAESLMIADRVKVTIAGANAGDSVNVWLIVC